MKKQTKKAKKPAARKQKFPRGWNVARVLKVLEHYESQTEDEAVAEDEAAYQLEGQTMMIVPSELVPAIRRLLSRHRGA
jgi:hypothetical protein